MNRRGFLGALLAGAVLDPEKLLWVPGKKLISIPKPPLLSAGMIMSTPGGHFFTLGEMVVIEPGELFLTLRPALLQKDRCSAVFRVVTVESNSFTIESI